MDVKETVAAGKAKLGAEDALRLAAAASKVIVSRGARVQTFEVSNFPPDRESLLKAMLGPTGNLRAPAIRRGKTLLIGFNEDAYTSALA